MALSSSTAELVSRPGFYEGYSTARYDGHERISRYVSMPDGIRLAIDIFRPTRDGVLHSERLPVVWTHHRYHRASLQNDVPVDYINFRGGHMKRLLNHGYVIAVVDVRGGGASFGNQQGFFPPQEAKDAYTITEWLAEQPWSTGAIGMFGRSYLGITQFFAASEAPPHLKALFPEMHFFDTYDFVWPGGVYRNDFLKKWEALTQNLDRGRTTQLGEFVLGQVLPVDGPEGPALRDAAIEDHKANCSMFEMWGGVPFRNSISPITGEPIHIERSPASRLAQINAAGIPIYNLGGWFDSFPRDAVQWFANLKASPKLVMGPWFHGETDGFDLGAEQHRWYDRWLKGVDNGIDREAPIWYAVIDAPEEEKWREAKSWPIREAKATDFFLGGGTTGTASQNDGLLLRDVPAGANSSDSRAVDYSATTGAGSRWAAAYGAKGVYPDMAENDARGLTWTSPPLERDVEVIGHPLVHMWVTSSTGDFVACVYLEDVEPSGVSRYITEGVLRASHRALNEPPYDNLGLPWHGCLAGEQAKLPDAPTELVFDMQPTAKRFRKGHRIRLTLQCADRDNLDVPETPTVVTVYRDEKHPSRISLPVVEVGGR